MSAKPIATITTNSGKIVEIYDYSSDDDCSSCSGCSDCEFLCFWCSIDIGEYDDDAFFYEPNGQYYCKSCYDLTIENE